MTNRRKSLVRVASIVACLVFVSIAIASTATWWHGLTQNQRDGLIVDRAEDDLGNFTGLQCKEWVREVIDDASNGEVIIPATRSNNYQWNSHNYITAYPCTACPPQGIAPGRAIQMKWRASNGNITPHTAIILSSTSGGMHWIDCNWLSDGVVRTHYVSYNQFNACVGYNYTIYKIR